MRPAPTCATGSPPPPAAASPPSSTWPAHQIRHNFDGILAAVELDLSNGRLEGINGKIRLIQRRGYGYHSIDALAASIYLCLGGIPTHLPTRP
jgi:transposase